MATSVKLVSVGDPCSSDSEFRRLVGSLQYLTLTQLDITYIASKVAQFMTNVQMCHWNAVKCIFRYLSRSQTQGMYLQKSINSEIEVMCV